ncbi:MAG: drug resistance transporter, EmrB/QacA subfamily [Solirubrobacterales bacterium]|nr:drug resistance transporter, EmrB/QacA subfamily [Solirubrobacterales bacterium]
MTSSTTVPPPSDRSRWLALYTLCAGVLMIVLDGTVVNVALPSIQDDLDFSSSGLAWVVNAYLIAFGGFLLLSGRLGDLIGQRRMFLLGMGVFTLASLACALAPSQEVLIGARFVQGIGGALNSAVVLGMIVTMFPEPREQGKALGVFGFVASAGGSIGLLLGGVLTDAVSWHWIFLINVPLGVAVAYAATRLVEDKPGIGIDQGADLPGAAMLTIGLMVGVYAILKVGEPDASATLPSLLGLASIVLLTLFVVRQARIAQPLMPLRLFKSRNVSGANVVQSFMVAGMFGMFFLGALYLQRVLGYSPLEVGFAFLPSTLVMGLMSLKISGPVVLRFGGRKVLVPALLCIGAGLLLFARTPVDGDYLADVLAPTVLIALGAGLGFPAIMGLAMSGATPSDSGLASGLVNTSTQVGGAIGLAVLATFAAQRTETLRAEGESVAAALNGGYHLAYLIGAGFVVVGVLVALFVLEPAPAPAPGAHAAEDPAVLEPV